MWTGFDPRANPLLPLLERAIPTGIEVVSKANEPVDLELGSVYPSAGERLSGLARVALGRTLRSPQDVRQAFQSPGKSANARWGIWYTPENHRPPATGWDATLSFEVGGWKSNAYLPFWLLNTDAFGAGDPGFLGRPLRLAELANARDVSPSSRPGFCCAIIRNPDPVRLRAIKELSKIGKVDVFGPLAGRPIPSKLEVFKAYRFALCFENDLYPGYVTEKVFDAWTAGTLPIYWGLDADRTLNPSAMINMANLDGFDGLLERVSEVDRDRSELDNMASRPLLDKVPSVDAVVQLVADTLAG